MYAVAMGSLSSEDYNVSRSSSEMAETSIVIHSMVNGCKRVLNQATCNTESDLFLRLILEVLACTYGGNVRNLEDGKTNMNFQDLRLPSPCTQARATR